MTKDDTTYLNHAEKRFHLGPDTLAKLPEFKKFETVTGEDATRVFRRVHFDQCEYGLSSPDGKYRLARATTFLASHPALLQYLNKRCSGNHEHLRICGRDRVPDGIPDPPAPTGARPLRSPKAPSAAEKARHAITHLPYRAWCPFCVPATPARPRRSCPRNKTK